MRHIRAGTRLGVNPPSPQKEESQCSLSWDDACWGSCTHLSHLCRQCATQPSIKQHSRARNTHRVHIDRFQIIRVRVIRLLRTVRIECARSLKELLLEVRGKPTSRDRKRTVCAVSRPPTRDLVRLDLQSFNFRPSAALTPYLTHLFQKRDEVLRAPPGILVHRLPVVIVRGRRAHVYHDCQRFKNRNSPGHAWVEINQKTEA